MREKDDPASVRVLHWPGTERQALLRELVLTATDGWARDWCGGQASAGFDITSRLAHEATEDMVQGWQALTVAADADDGVWLNELPDATGVFASLLQLVPAAGAKTLSSLTGETVRVACDDFVLRLKRVLAHEGHSTGIGYAASIPTTHSRPWSGAVQIDIRVNDVVVARLHFGPRRVQVLAPAVRKTASSPTPPLAGLGQALSRQPVVLRAELTGVEITLGQMQSLALGDVVLLPHLLADPLQVTDASGQAVCAGFLGQQEGKKAIELVRAVSTVGV